jgi:hypothetical protein
MNSITERLWKSDSFKHMMSAMVIVMLFSLLALPFYMMSALGASCSDYTGDKYLTCSGNSLISSFNITEGANVTACSNSNVCTYGCDANLAQCKPHPMIQYAVFGAAIVGGLALFGWISKR